MKRTLATGVLTTATAAALLTGGTIDAVAASALPGPGWTAAIQHQDSATDGQGRLVMVRPTGGILRIGEVSDDAHIQDVSADGRHVITSRQQDGRIRATIWDTHTGTPRYFRTSGHAALQFGGDGVVQLPSNSQRTFTVRRLDGTVRRTFSAQPLPPGRTYVSAVVSPDGKTVVEAGKSIAIRNAATGTVLRRTASPETQTTKRDCTVGRAWGTQAVGVRCGSTEANDVHNIYRTPFQGESVKVAELFTLGWPTTSGVVHDRNGRTVADWALEKSGGPRSLPLGKHSDVVGSKGNRVFVLSNPNEGTDSTLFSYDVTTGARTTLGGTKATGGGVITDAQPIDGLQ